MSQNSIKRHASLRQTQTTKASPIIPNGLRVSFLPVSVLESCQRNLLSSQGYFMAPFLHGSPIFLSSYKWVKWKQNKVPGKKNDRTTIHFEERQKAPTHWPYAPSRCSPFRQDCVDECFSLCPLYCRTWTARKKAKRLRLPKNKRTIEIAGRLSRDI